MTISNDIHTNGAVEDIHELYQHIVGAEHAASLLETKLDHLDRTIDLLLHEVEDMKTHK